MHPKNSSMKPIYLDRGELVILGRVAGVVRKV
jgi:hypothetical protein